MTATAGRLDARPPRRGQVSLAEGITDVVAISRRNLLVASRQPEIIVFGVVQPILLLVLFVYVFGGAVQIPGVPYIQYIVPAVIVQAVAFAGIDTAIGLAADLRTGIVDRFRSLPMTRSAVLTGRVLADTVKMTIRILIVVGVALLMGFRFEAGPLRTVAAAAVALLFGFAFSWVFATIGLAVRNEEAANAASFSWLFPLVFVSSAYVPVETLPGWLQPIAWLNPITAAVDTIRALALGGEVGEPLLRTLAWVAGMVAIFGTFAVRLYRRTG